MTELSVNITRMIKQGDGKNM